MFYLKTRICGRVDVFSTDGKKLHAQELQGKAIHLSYFGPGIYTATVAMEDKCISQKIILAKCIFISLIFDHQYSH